MNYRIQTPKINADVSDYENDELVDGVSYEILRDSDLRVNDFGSHVEVENAYILSESDLEHEEYSSLEEAELDHELGKGALDADLDKVEKLAASLQN